jgi:His/Glu/Gln/Arg/opine family amino acid ABC transporter permease subunit
MTRSINPSSLTLGKRKMKDRILWLMVGVLVFFWVGAAGAGSDSDTFTVALTGKYPPFSFEPGGKLAGFDVDVSRSVGRHLGRSVVIVKTEWDGILAGLLAGKYDAIIGSMAITPERQKAVNFSSPYYISGAQLFIHKDNQDNIRNIEDCENKRIGVVLGETYEHYLTQHYPGIDVRTYKSTFDIFEDLKNGRLAGFVSDKLIGSWQIKNGNMPFRPAGDLLYEENIGIPVKKDRPELLEQINTALARMRESGELDRLFDQWFGIKQQALNNSGLTTSIIAGKLIKGFTITLGVAGMSLVMGFFLAIPSGVILNRQKGITCVILRGIVDFIRGTPVLIQLFFIYFGGPQIGLTMSPITAAVVTLSINATAYLSEVIRAGLMSVDPGQKLAGRSLGLTKFQVFRLIIWPQAFRIALPPLINSVIALMKDTALISIISVGEVIRETQSIISVTFNPTKYYFITAVMFFIVTFPLMKLAGQVELRLRQKGFTHD